MSNNMHRSNPYTFPLLLGLLLDPYASVPLIDKKSTKVLYISPTTSISPNKTIVIIRSVVNAVGESVDGAICGSLVQVVA
jgi:hypothetical protein